MDTFLIILIGLLILGVLLNFAAFIWTCVVASRHTAWWLLAFLLVPLVQGLAVRWLLGPEALSSIGWIGFLFSLPLARLVFAGKHWPDARNPMVLTAVATALVWVPLGLYREQLLSLAVHAAQARGSTGPGGRGAVGPGNPTASRESAVTSEALLREQAAMEAAEQRQRRAQETRVSFDKHRAEAGRPLQGTQRPPGQAQGGRRRGGGGVQRAGRAVCRVVETNENRAGRPGRGGR